MKIYMVQSDGGHYLWLYDGFASWTATREEASVYTSDEAAQNAGNYASGCVDTPDFSFKVVKIDVDAALDVLRDLSEVYDLGDYIYDLREREGKGWDGPLVTKWSDAVTRAKILLSEAGHECVPKQTHQLSRPLQHGTYIGNQLTLKGKTALLMIFDTNIKAQFDDVTTGMGHGWHAFQPEEWEIDEKCPWQSEQPNEE